MKSIIFKKMSHLNKIVLLYNDGQNVYIVGINDDNDNISNSCSCLMRSININLNIFFRLRGQIPMETVGNACKDIYILYKLKDKRVTVIQNYQFNEHEIMKKVCSIKNCSTSRIQYGYIL